MCLSVSVCMCTCACACVYRMDRLKGNGKGNKDESLTIVDQIQYEEGKNG